MTKVAVPPIEESPIQPSAKGAAADRSLIPRFHLFEIEDQSWCPDFLRDYCTDYLRLAQSWIDLPARVAPLVLETLEAIDSHQIIDLCSGGSGPIVDLAIEITGSKRNVNILMTDKFPNLRGFERAQRDARQANVPSDDAATSELCYLREPVDATSVPHELTGLRTLFNALHHFQPEQARKVLADAVEARQAIAIFEVSQRRLLSLSRMLFVPLMVLLVTPLIRPFRLGRLFWTYLMPAVPLICLWDGMVSQLRAYSPEELRTLADASGDGAFRWQQGVIPVRGGEVTYLLGLPESSAKSSG